jgi:hypothetical protein
MDTGYTHLDGNPWQLGGSHDYMAMEKGIVPQHTGGGGVTDGGTIDSGNDWPWEQGRHFESMVKCGTEHGG